MRVSFTWDILMFDCYEKGCFVTFVMLVCNNRKMAGALVERELYLFIVLYCYIVT